MATYINGQNEDVKAAVGEGGKLQLFASSQRVQDGQVEFGGGLASELTIGDGEKTNVQKIDVTSVAGSQKRCLSLMAHRKWLIANDASLGAFQNRFNHAISNLEYINENVNASNSRIRDTDYAKETTQMTKTQILQQASTLILAQAKQSPSSALACWANQSELNSGLAQL